MVLGKERRRLIAKREENRGWLSWVGYFGVVGWSVALPTAGGTLLGWWIDGRWPSDRSWALMLMAAGLVIGCVVAWRWLHQEGGFR